jgi:hypothetical protein
MNDFESRRVEDRTFESGLLVAANDESVQSGGLHPRADVLETAIDLLLTWQNDP